MAPATSLPHVTAPGWPSGAKVNRSTYTDAQLAAQQAASQPSKAEVKSNVPTVESPLFQSGVKFQGDSQGGPGGGWVPPDTHGATGNNQIVEVTNSDVTAFNGGTGAQIFNVSLNSFFGYSGASYFDPRATFHPIYNRWFITSPSFENSSGQQIFSIFVSSSPNINGGGCTYSYDTKGITGGFYDYPQVGFDHDALFLTANIFNPGFVGADLLIWPLAEMTNCLGMGGWHFSGLSGTLNAPLVYDRNPRTYFAAWTGTGVNKYTLRDSGRIAPELAGPTFIDTADRANPGGAPQNVSIDLLDTLDGRFGSAGSQWGNFLYLVNSTKSGTSGTFAYTHWLKIDTAANTVVLDCLEFSSGSSHDFMPSIAANSTGDVFLNWSATKFSTSANVVAIARGIENTNTSASCDGASESTVVFGSGMEYGNGNGTAETLRWGDYSSIFLKFNQDRAIAFNELVNTYNGTGVGTSWTTGIAEVRFS